MNLAYEDFALPLSLLDIAICLALFGIVVRRAQVRGKSVMIVEPVRDHARRVEGPLVSGALIASVVVTILALTNGAIHDQLVHVAVGFVRGALLVIGVWLLAAYWTVRSTWLR